MQPAFSGIPFGHSEAATDSRPGSRFPNAVIWLRTGRGRLLGVANDRR